MARGLTKEEMVEIMVKHGMVPESPIMVNTFYEAISEIIIKNNEALAKGKDD